MHTILPHHIPKDWVPEWKHYEAHYNNIVVENRFSITPVKPFKDRGDLLNESR